MDTPCSQSKKIIAICWQKKTPISAAEIGSQLQTFCESIMASIAQQSTSTILMQHATPIKPPSLSPSTPHTLQNTGSLANPNRITRRRLCRRISGSFRCVIRRESCREGRKTDATVILDLSAKNHEIPGYTRPVEKRQDVRHARHLRSLWSA
jgi:hypothetical protein